MCNLLFLSLFETLFTITANNSLFLITIFDSTIIVNCIKLNLTKQEKLHHFDCMKIFSTVGCLDVVCDDLG